MTYGNFSLPSWIPVFPLPEYKIMSIFWWQLFTIDYFLNEIWPVLGQLIEKGMIWFLKEILIPQCVRWKSQRCPKNNLFIFFLKVFSQEDRKYSKEYSKALYSFLVFCVCKSGKLLRSNTFKTFIWWAKNWKKRGTNNPHLYGTYLSNN